LRRSAALLAAPATDGHDTDDRVEEVLRDALPGAEDETDLRVRRHRQRRRRDRGRVRPGDRARAAAAQGRRLSVGLRACAD
jgi:hypothetical protein